MGSKQPYQHASSCFFGELMLASAWRVTNKSRQMLVLFVLLIHLVSVNSKLDSLTQD